MSASSPGPLRGLRILELPAVGPLPLFGTIFADFGATVVRIDKPPRLENRNRGGMHITNRPTLPLDLKTPEGRDKALELVRGADVLVEGYRPGVMERLGLGPDVCLAANPRLIYGRMTGWGQEGPLAHDPGHDINYLALTGLLSAIGVRDEPVPPLNLLGDFAGGSMLLAFGVLAAVYEAQKSGLGQVLDVAMIDGVNVIGSMVHEMRARGAWKTARRTNMLDGAAPFYRCYRCADGEWLAVGTTELKFRATLGAAIGFPEFGTPASDDPANWAAMSAKLESIFAQRTRDAWMDHLADVETCIAPVLGLDEAPLHPHAVARDSFRPISGGWTPSPAPRFSRTPAGPAIPPSLDEALAAFGVETTQK
jgi:alpha-methylacyl-CoA racemase